MEPAYWSSLICCQHFKCLSPAAAFSVGVANSSFIALVYEGILWEQDTPALQIWVRDRRSGPSSEIPVG